MNEDLMDKPDKIGFEFIDIKEYLLVDVRYFQKQKFGFEVISTDYI